MQNKLPLIVAIIFGIIAFVGIGKYLRDRSKPPTYTRVMVAARDLDAGTILKQSDVTEKSIESSVVGQMSGFLRPQDAGAVIDRRLARSLRKGEIVMDVHLDREVRDPGVGKFAELIRKGERALSLPIDNVGAVSNFIRPGDYVDILANMEIPEIQKRQMSIPNQGVQEYEERVYEPTTVYLFQNVKVLAVGTDYLKPDAPESQKASLGAGSVTIAVTPEEAQVLSFAMRNGRQGTSGARSGVTFTLLLRRPGDPDVLVDKDLNVVTYDDVVKLTKLNTLQKERDERMSKTDPDVFLGGVNVSAPATP